MAKVGARTFRTVSGSEITDEVAEKLADELESDTPVAWKAKRPVGRPSLDGVGASPRVTFRLPKELYGAASERALAEGTTVSALAREALEKRLVE
jgi:hypothetical protein